MTNLTDEINAMRAKRGLLPLAPGEHGTLEEESEVADTLALGQSFITAYPQRRKALSKLIDVLQSEEDHAR